MLTLSAHEIQDMYLGWIWFFCGFLWFLYKEPIRIRKLGINKNFGTTFLYYMVQYATVKRLG